MSARIWRSLRPPSSRRFSVRTKEVITENHCRRGKLEPETPSQWVWIDTLDPRRCFPCAWSGNSDTVAENNRWRDLTKNWALKHGFLHACKHHRRQPTPDDPARLVPNRGLPAVTLILAFTVCSAFCVLPFQTGPPLSYFLSGRRPGDVPLAVAAAVGACTLSVKCRSESAPSRLLLHPVRGPDPVSPLYRLGGPLSSPTWSRPHVGEARKTACESGQPHVPWSNAVLRPFEQPARCPARVSAFRPGALGSVDCYARLEGPCELKSILRGF